MIAKYKLSLEHKVDDNKIELSGLIEETDYENNNGAIFFDIKGYLNSSEGNHKVVGASKLKSGKNIQLFIYAAHEKPRSDIYPLIVQASHMNNSEGIQTTLNLGPLDPVSIHDTNSIEDLYSKLSDLSNSYSKTEKIAYNNFDIERIK